MDGILIGNIMMAQPIIKSQNWKAVVDIKIYAIILIVVSIMMVSPKEASAQATCNDYYDGLDESVAQLFSTEFLIPLTEKKSTHSGSLLLNQLLKTCPADNELTRTNMELFILHPDWSANRTATGTNGLNISQLEVLNESQNSSVCQYFNSEFNDVINETWSKGGSKYHIVYYKAGSFYFVSIVIAQPSDPEYVSVGLSYLIVFDDNLNEIKGYSF